jgi:sporulation protein YlmC with PRC-barrel domain
VNARPGQVTHDIVLRLLDHQIVGPDDELLGNVDDLELVNEGGEWLVTGLMVGPAALSQRMPGRLGAWLYAAWRRMHPAEDPAPTVVPIENVVAVDSAVHVDEAAARALAGGFGFELWLREHVVSRLPGALGEDDQRGGDSETSARRARRRADEPIAPTRAPRSGSRGVSSVIGRTVVDAEGHAVGRVGELRCVGRPPNSRQVPLRVRLVLYTRHLTGSELGYSIDSRQGPRLVRRIVRTWQQHDRLVDVDDVADLETVEGDLRLLPSASPRHPHEEA